VIHCPAKHKQRRDGQWIRMKFAFRSLRGIYKCGSARGAVGFVECWAVMTRMPPMEGESRLAARVNCTSERRTAGGSLKDHPKPTPMRQDAAMYGVAQVLCRGVWTSGLWRSSPEVILLERIVCGVRAGRERAARGSTC